ncbi:MAG: YbaN family protein [Defluviitaleaceae bacterium]|nr:YbaN family protein [Defluviitaleaceae bacterium]
MKQNETPPKTTGPKKYAYIIVGLLSLGIGAVGVVLPLVPTTPFVLLAAICFGKSSHRLHTWFTSTRLYKKNIEGMITKKALTIRAKLMLLAMITGFMGLSFLAMRLTSAPLAPQFILAVVWVLHVLYFGFWVRTAK